MYRVIIAEDEPNVREGIAKTVDFAAAGFSLCGMCENGREALALIEKHRPELVITDIRMPVMDGIALAEEAKERFPKTKIVFLTGHSEFEYAKAAVALKVNEYVLKPVSAKILRELLARIK
ncbi:MAG: response regulator, partial [Eubacteriales bacterium]